MPNIQIPDNIPPTDKLAAMELVAKMRAAADKVGAGFIGGFIAPDGTKFIQTNLDDEDDINNLLPEDLRWKSNGISMTRNVRHSPPTNVSWLENANVPNLKLTLQ